MGVTYRNNDGDEVEVAEPDPDKENDPGWQRVSDDRTVLYALPEDQPDSLSEGATSNQADLDLPPADKPAGDGGAPAKNATKDEWVDHAVAQGADRDEAESMTKAELVDTYGG